MENNEDIEIKNDDDTSQSELDLIEDDDSQEATKYPQSERHSESVPLILRNYFQIVSKIVNSKATGECLFCPGEKIFSVNLKTNSNLVKHLKRVHPEKYREYKREINEKSQSRKRHHKSDHAPSGAGARRQLTLGSNEPSSNKLEFGQKTLNYNDEHFVNICSNSGIKTENSLLEEEKNESEIEDRAWLNPDLLTSTEGIRSKEKHESLRMEGIKLDNEYKKLKIQKIKIEIALMKKRAKCKRKTKYYSMSSSDYSE